MRDLGLAEPFNHYGEVKHLTLPNSGISISYSTKFFTYWDEGKTYYPEVILAPEKDLTISKCYEDYAAGKDPVIEAVLAW